MKMYSRFVSQQGAMRRRLKRAVVAAYRKHGSVRVAAKALGMPRVTYHEWLTGKVRA